MASRAASNVANGSEAVPAFASEPSVATEEITDARLIRGRDVDHQDHRKGDRGERGSNGRRCSTMDSVYHRFHDHTG